MLFTATEPPTAAMFGIFSVLLLQLSVRPWTGNLKIMKEQRTMTDKQTQETNTGNMRKDPEQWTTGDEPMTGAQRSYLHTLAEEAEVEVEDDLTKAEASKRIDELQAKTGRGES